MASKFSVTDVQDDATPAAQNGEDTSEGHSPRLVSDSVKVAIEGRSEEQQADTFTPLISQPFPTNASTAKSHEGDEGGTGNLALYESELRTRPKISHKLSQLIRYDPTPANPKTMKKKKKKKSAQMGTLMGVYLPCLQNILGVILFLRLTWIVGIAGWLEALVIVCLCCLSTVITAISLSAIATNGVVPSGGPYFLISRNLGPEIGGAVGILFYLGNAFASSLYILGAIELLLKYLAPQLVFLSDDPNDRDALYNSMRIYGTILLIFLALIVFVGVKFVNYFASFALFCVIISVITIYTGAFDPRPRLPICAYDGVLLKNAVNEFKCPADVSDLATTGNTSFCFELEMYIEELNILRINRELNISNSTPADPGYGFTLNMSCCPNNPVLQDIFRMNEGAYDPEREGDGWRDGVRPGCIIGIPGITDISSIAKNALAQYSGAGEAKPGTPPVGNQIVASVATSFLVLVGVFYPSVTGIMAGSNRSGDLKDPQKSIPVGTLAAIGTTTFIYITCLLFFGGTISGPVLRDQLGDAVGSLVVAEFTGYIGRWIILIGALLSTIGAALQTLTGAPRLLQAIAIDNIIPFLKFFTKTFRNEPTLALLLTVALAEVGVLIAVLEYVAPILTMFFLMLYLSVNASTALQSLLRAPNWRPRFKFYHWSLSIFGALLCLTLMFIVNWYYALGAIIIALLIYKYIEYRGAEKEWGDGLRGLSLQAARYSLLKLEESPPHTKNWRPQLLVLMKLNVSYIPSQPKLLSFASQLKTGKGLTLITSVLEGEYNEMKAEAIAAKQTLKQFVTNYKIQGFCDVSVSPNVSDGLCTAIQCSGLGGMKPNCVLIAWPDAWRKKDTASTFMKAIRAVSQKDWALLVARGINWFPSNEDKGKGSIDVWWVVHDGGLLMLLPFLLRQHKVWKRCSLRIFSVAEISDNSIQMKKDLQAFLYQIRIEAEVHVIEMPDHQISDYTYERTLIMEQRTEMLRQMKLTNRDRAMEVQSRLSLHHVSRSPSLPRDSLPTQQRSATRVTFAEPELSDVLSLDEEPVNVDVRTSRVMSKAEEARIEEIAVALSDDDGGIERGQRRDSVTEEAIAEEGDGIPMIVVTNTTDGSARMKRQQSSLSSSMSMDYLQVQSPSFQVNRNLDPANVRRMDTAVRLNELMVEHSHDAQLVLVNLPGPPNKAGATEEQNYMEFLDVLTEGLDRVLMVRGGGREVITIYS